MILVWICGIIHFFAAFPLIVENSLGFVLFVTIITFFGWYCLLSERAEGRGKSRRMTMLVLLDLLRKVGLLRKSPHSNTTNMFQKDPTMQQGVVS